MDNKNNYRKKIKQIKELCIECVNKITDIYSKNSKLAINKLRPDSFKQYEK